MPDPNYLPGLSFSMVVVNYDCGQLVCEVFLISPARIVLRQKRRHSGRVFVSLQPFFVAEEGEHRGQGDGHDEDDEKEIKIGVVERQENGVHAPDAGQKRERHEDHGKNREHFDHFVHLYRHQNVVGFFQGFDGFLGAFQSVFDAAVGPVEDVEIMPVILAVEINAGSAQTLEDHALRFHDAPKIKHFHFQAGDFHHQFALLPGEDAGFQLVNLFYHGVDFREDFFQKSVEDQEKDMGRVV